MKQTDALLFQNAQFYEAFEHGDIYCGRDLVTPANSEMLSHRPASNGWVGRGSTKLGDYFPKRILG